MKEQLTEDNLETVVSLSVCRLWCDDEGVGSIWPRPTEIVQFSRGVIRIDPNNITIRTENFQNDPIFWPMARERFLEMEQRKLPTHEIESGGYNLVIDVVVEVDDMGNGEHYANEVENHYRVEFFQIFH